MKKNKEHKQVKILYPGDVRGAALEIEVDEKMAPLLQELWKADISTMFSCQGNKKISRKHPAGLAYIMFNDFKDLDSFMLVYMSLLEKKSFQTLDFYFEVQPHFSLIKINYYGIVRFPKKYIKKLTKAFVESNERWETASERSVAKGGRFLTWSEFMKAFVCIINFQESPKCLKT